MNEKLKSNRKAILQHIHVADNLYLVKHIKLILSALKRLEEKIDHEKTNTVHR